MQNFYRTKLYTRAKYNLRPLIYYGTLALIFLISWSSVASATESETINTVHITLNVTNARIKDVFSIIEQKTNFSIGYDNALDVNQRVSVKVDNQTVSQTLHTVLKNY